VREITGDLWAYEADARCITTNGTLTRSGRGVMGRGVAEQAKARYLGIEKRLAGYLRLRGNHVGVLLELSVEVSVPLVVFPVKHEWHEHADPNLIKRSADELVALTDERGWEVVLLPRPGCGNGHLSWALVEKIVRPRLDDRFVVVYQGTGPRWQA
jgi:Macro domain